MGVRARVLLQVASPRYNAKLAALLHRVLVDKPPMFAVEPKTSEKRHIRPRMPRCCVQHGAVNGRQLTLGNGGVGFARKKRQYARFG